MADSDSRGRGTGNGTLGNLESLALAEIIQSLSLGRKTARITVTSGSRFGHIWIEKGQAKHARAGRLFGEFAFYEMVGWKTGQFLLEPDVLSETRSLDHDPMFLVMEGSRRIDEAEEKVEATRQIDVLETVPLKAGTDAPSRPLKLLKPRPVKPDRKPPAHHAPPPPGRSRRPLLLAGALVPLCAVGLLLGATAMLEPRAVPRPVPRPARIVLPSDVPEADTVAPDPAPEEGLGDVDAPPELPVNSASRARAPVPEPSVPASDPDPAPVTSPTAGDPDATPAPEPERIHATAVEEQAYLRISGKSSFRSGTLVVRVDGARVYTRTLSADEGKTKRFFKRMVGRAGETFETVVAIEPGEHDVHAQVTVGDEAAGYDSTLTLEVEPGATHDLRLVAGRVVGRPLTLRMD